MITPRPLGYRILIGTADGPLYVRAMLEETGAVEWTPDRDASMLFAEQSEAAYVRDCIVACRGQAAAVVPTQRTATEGAIADLNDRAEW